MDALLCQRTHRGIPGGGGQRKIMANYDFSLFTVLIAEDNLYMRSMLRTLLYALGVGKVADEPGPDDAGAEATTGAGANKEGWPL